jgi:hypothetical protein
VFAVHDEFDEGTAEYEVMAFASCFASPSCVAVQIEGFGNLDHQVRSVALAVLAAGVTDPGMALLATGRWPTSNLTAPTQR